MSFVRFKHDDGGHGGEFHFNSLKLRNIALSLM